jgi:predicted alpha/beta hydrolase
VLALSFSDDELLRADGSEMIHSAYAAASVDYHLVQPAEVGLPRVGHFGFFRPGPGAVLWPRVKAWIDARVSAGAAAAAV